MSASQCDRVAAVLADGQPHTIQEIHDRAGTMRLNSRISDLRKRGLAIEYRREGPLHVYQLLPSPMGDPGVGHPVETGSASDLSGEETANRNHQTPSRPVRRASSGEIDEVQLVLAGVAA